MTPSEGRILFDDRDVTDLPPDQRNIAQVFQFPVIYDTMTVRDNLAFPLRNRGVDEARIAERVAEIAAMLEVEDMLDIRASHLSPDNKQKISMGRGLVRDDVNVVMFDEPLTVIDPHLKWKLRSKLKELHQRVRATMIYVTHDQTEALTFADQVVVMQDGEIVQIGTPVELFERPQHTFVGHFIGSPGMNVLPATETGGTVTFRRPDRRAGRQGHGRRAGRPNWVSGPNSSRLQIAGSKRGCARCRTWGATRWSKRWWATRASRRVTEGALPGQGEAVHLAFDPRHTRLYRDGWIATEARA